MAIDDGFNTTRPPRSESLSLKGISVRPSYDRGKAVGKDGSAAIRRELESAGSLAVVSAREKRDDDDYSRSACTLVAAASAEKASAISVSKVAASAVSSGDRSVAAAASLG